MGTQTQTVLDSDELNETDVKILDLLREGRVTPPLVRDKLEISREYASERLIRLNEHDHVDRPAPGLYELVDDPLGDGDPDDDVDETTANAIARQHELEMELEECREKLAAARESASVDAHAAVVALDDLEAALDRGERHAAEEALQRAREALDDE